MRFKLCLFTLLLFVFSIGFVSAHDTGTIGQDSVIMENSSSVNDVVLPSDSNHVGNSLSDSYHGDYHDLKKDISQVKSEDIFDWYDLNRDIQNLKPGEVYNLKHDCIKPDMGPIQGIDIKVDNVTINGNGHVIKGSDNPSNTIDGDVGTNNKGNIFTVTGDNVKIDNLIISGAGFELTLNKSFDLKRFDSGFNNDYTILNFSPICWIGNNGICSNCTFRDNKAFNGGSISWLGNGGLINNIQFINSSATRVGSAIYLEGNDFDFKNIRMNNLQSGWAEPNPIFIASLFDVFRPSFYVNVFDSQIDLTECLYDCVLYGTGTFDNVTFHSEIVNNDISLMFINEIYGNDIKFILGEEFRFDNVVYDNITTSKIIDNVFDTLKSLNYHINFSYNAFYNVTDKSSYSKAIDLNTNIFDNYKKYLNVDVRYLNPSGVKCCHQFVAPYKSGLHVDILDSFNNAKTWHPVDMGFDLIYIDGHNHVISGNAKVRQEYKFADVLGGKEYIFMVEHLTIKKFNNAIVNDGGYCILNDVCFNNNRMDYFIHADWGAALKNAGLTICTNCTFMDNECSNGGAIFNQASLTLNNCSFRRNHAFHHGNDILNVDKGIVMLNGVQVKKSSDVVKYEYKKSLSTAWHNAIKYGSMGFSFVAGFAVGFFTANPVIGFAVGAGIGLALGVGSTVAIAKTTWDINFDVTETAIITIGGNVLAGGIGGVIGGIAGIAYWGVDTSSEIGTASEAGSYLNSGADTASEAGSYLNSGADMASEAGSLNSGAGGSDGFIHLSQLSDISDTGSFYSDFGSVHSGAGGSDGFIHLSQLPNA